ncbi:H2A domain containing protein [Golovinomyces cichoracearum]|uniref:DNA polymerase epsilon subunit D n=1 Tax=Golovinomyces cichoracearum TaxID=62708 RepID=A0A420HG14_9PEZI|nr:H2A domain containing protein [Golovinomyces cichoracearum]
MGATFLQGDDDYLPTLQPPAQAKHFNLPTMPVQRGDASNSTLSDDGYSTTKDPPGINIEDLNLPKSIVTRLAKGVLPANTQIQSNAMIGLTKSATLFVNYIASQANERAAIANRKTVSINDVFSALDDSEFSMWRSRLEAELQSKSLIKDESSPLSYTINSTPQTKLPYLEYNENIGQRKEKIKPKEAEGVPASKKIKQDKSSPSPSAQNVFTHQNATHKNGQNENENNKETVDSDTEEDLLVEEEEEEEGEEEGEENREDITKEGEEMLDEDEEVHMQIIDEALDNGEDSS